MARSYVSALLVALALAGCTAVQPTDFSRINAGTPRGEIEAILGQPIDSWAGPEGQIYSYEYDHGAPPLRPLFDPARVETARYACGYCAAPPLLAFTIEAIAYPFRRPNQVEHQKGVASILYDQDDRMVAASFAGSIVENRERLLKHARLAAGAEDGDPEAQYELAHIIRDDIQREALYRSAAAQGLADAQFELATQYAGATEAWTLLCRAAHQGHVQAQVSLADRYSLGTAPVAPDRIKAYYWYRLAERNGYDGPQDQQPGYYKTENGLACCISKPLSEKTAEEMSPAEIALAEGLLAAGSPDPAACQQDGGAVIEGASGAL